MFNPTVVVLSTVPVILTKKVRKQGTTTVLNFIMKVSTKRKLFSEHWFNIKKRTRFLLQELQNFNTKSLSGHFSYIIFHLLSSALDFSNKISEKWPIQLIFELDRSFKIKIPDRLVNERGLITWSVPELHCKKTDRQTDIQNVCDRQLN